MDRRTQLQSQEDIDMGLSVFLKHTAASDQRVICTLAQVCKAWRTAVQQSTVVIAISVKGCFDDRFNREAIASFASWLPTHCHLVHSVEISGTCNNCHFDPACDNDVAVLQAALQQAQLSSSNGWKLQQYRSPSVVSTSLLRTLPASTLTMLEVPGDIWPLEGAAAAPATLTQLRCLTLGNTHDAARRDIVHAVAALTNLTKFSIAKLPLDYDLVGSLPVSLWDVSIVYHHARVKFPAIQLQHLTALKQLSIRSGLLYENVALPSQIQQLKLYNCGDPNYLRSSMDIFGISRLRQLHTLDMKVNALDSFVSLTMLSELQHLRIHCEYHPDGVRFLHALPKLVRLQLLFWDITMSQFAEWTNSITACTGLTELQIDVTEYYPGCHDEFSDGEVEADARGEGATLNLWHWLASLPNMSSLVLGTDLTGGEGDIVYGYPAGQAARSGLGSLSELSGLTCLELKQSWSMVLDAADMQCLAWSLTGLQVLHVGPSDWGVVPLPAIGHLSCLQSLWYGRDGSLSQEQAQQGLRHLTGLSMLTDLHGFDAAGPQAVEDFWAALNRKSSVVC